MLSIREVDQKTEDSLEKEKNSTKPEIQFYTNNSTIVKFGEPVLLEWRVTNATDIELLGFEKLPEGGFYLNDQIEVWPIFTNTYYIRAYGNDGSVVTKAVTIFVEEE